MAWSDTSGWNPQVSQYGSKKPVGEAGADGLTNKQLDMSTARNPMNFNQQNVAEPQGEKPPLPQQENKEKAQAAQQNVTEMKKKLGGAAYKIQGLVNKFLTQGTEQVRTKMTQPTYKLGADGKYTVSNLTPDEMDLSAVTAEKMAEIENIKREAAPFYEKDPTGKWQKKSLSSTVRDLNHYETLDSTGKEKVDELIGLASMINEYETKGQGDSAEALALRQQLQDMDRTGAVSGMYSAIEEYRKFAGETPEDEGMSWYGDEGSEGTSLLDIMNMDNEKVASEIKKAVVASSGLFGGDYELGLKRALDTESAEAQAAQKEEVDFRNQLMDASKVYIGDFQKKFSDNATNIKSAFDTSAPSIIAELKKDGSPNGQAALEFFTQLHSSSPENFSQLINTLLYDPASGLQRSQRKVLQEYIGNITGDKGGGELGEWLNDLGTLGYITVDDPKNPGQEKNIELNAEEKYNVLTSMKSNKPEEVKKIFENALLRNEINLNEILSQTLPKGDVKGAVNAFSKSISDSLKTFVGSKTEDAVRKTLNIDDATWNGYSREQKSTIIADALRQNPKMLMMEVEGTAKRQLDNFKKSTAEVTANIDTFLKDVDNKKVKIQAAIDSATAQKTKAVTTLQGYLSNTFQKGFSQQNFDKYMTFFNKNSEYYTMLGRNYLDLRSAAWDLVTRDTLISIKNSNPELWDAIKNPVIEPYVNLNGNDAVAETMRDPNKSKQILSNFVTSLVTNSGNVLDQVMEKSPYYANVNTFLNTALSNANSAMKNLTDSAAKATENKANLAMIEAELGKRVVSPDEIGKIAQEVGHMFENSAVKMPDGLTPEQQKQWEADLKARYISMGRGPNSYKAAMSGDGTIAKETIDAMKAMTSETAIPTDFNLANAPTVGSTPEIDFQQNTSEADVGNFTGMMNNELTRRFTPLFDTFIGEKDKIMKTERNAQFQKEQIKYRYRDLVDSLEAEAIKMNILPQMFYQILAQAMTTRPEKEDVSSVRDNPARTSPLGGVQETSTYTEPSEEVQWGPSGASYTGSISDPEVERKATEDTKNVVKEIPSNIGKPVPGATTITHSTTKSGKQKSSGSSSKSTNTKSTRENSRGKT